MRTKLEAVRVQEVILDDSVNPNRYKRLGGFKAIGTILYTKINDITPRDSNTRNLPWARPLLSGIFKYPTVDEIVYIVKGPNNTYLDDRKTIAYYLPPIGIQGHPLHNAFLTY